MSNRALGAKENKGMPLGNLISQFFANVYLNELDQFVKHKLKVKYYIRYVDDFVILHHSKERLEKLKKEISNFLKKRLDLELHPGKSKVIKLDNGIKFLGFRVFFYFKLLRKSNIQNFERKLNRMQILFNEGVRNREKIVESLEGWLAYASHGNTYKCRIHLVRLFNKLFPSKEKSIKKSKKHVNFMRKIKKSELEFSTQKTLFLFCEGKSIEKIALERKIKESTVWAHFANLIEHNQISVWKILPRDKIFKILYRIYNKRDKLRDIKKKIER